MESVSGAKASQRPSSSGKDIYTPLDFARFETRFLRFLPFGSVSSILRCELSAASLMEPPPYTALSYRWGGPEANVLVEVNGVRTSISETLHIALRELSRRGVKIVWVDKLCINQDDSYERGQQVLRMGQIYSTAQNPYFKRVWIIQEIAKGHNVEVWWGSEAVPIDCLLALARTQVRDSLGAMGVFRIREAQSRIGVPRMLLAEAMLSTHHFEATDPRDKIYALLGMTLDGADVLPWPSYTDQPREVFRRTTEVMIAREGLTAMMLLARGRGASKNSPTWLPDWTTLPPTLPDWITNSISRGRETLSFKTSISGDCLTVSGVQLSAFAEVSDSVSASQTPSALLYRRELNNGGLSRHRAWETSSAFDVLALIWDNVMNVEGIAASDEDPAEVTTERKASAVSQLLGLQDVFGSSLIMSWVKATRSLPFRGRDVRQWAADYLSSLRELDPDIDHVLAMDYNRLYMSVDRLASLHMKLAVSTTHSLLMVHRDTHVDDLAYRLINCHIPIILRPTGTIFRFVGEVWAPEKQAGWINEYLQNAQWKDILIM
ncbi:hypothetical protein LTR53_011084 [Teratosphaeriaceae sp. CCFEE 6253]|nr:hypothetical protein LTR53_011084 [Teratosphaeriaceae sp. CCFEE 6253]